MANNVQYIINLVDHFSPIAEKIKRASTSISNGISKANKSLDKMKKKLNLVDHFSPIADKIKRASTSISNGISKANKSLDKMKEKLKSVKQSAEKLRSVSIKTFIAMAALLVLLAKSAIDYETSWVGITKTVDGTKSQMKALENQLKAVNKEIPISRKELYQVAENAGQLGIARKDVASFTSTISKLSLATNIAADEGSIMLSQFANITKMDPSNYTRLASTIVDLGNNLATQESNIMNFGFYIAGAGHAAGMSESQILGLAGAFSSLGIRAERGGSSVSRMISEINKSIGQRYDFFTCF